MKNSNTTFSRPAIWIIAVLSLALVLVTSFSLCEIKGLELGGQLKNTELEVFEHIAEQYISSMDFTIAGQPTVRYMTGYGVSSEDGTFYITFDFATYETKEGERILDDIDHAIIYFQKDAERGTYGHAFGYYDDAEYHPDGPFVRIEQ